MEPRTLLNVAFLFFVLVLTPLASFRAARVLKGGAGKPGATPPSGLSREQVLVSTLLSLAILGVLAWVTAYANGRNPFAIERLGLHELVAGVGVLAWHLALRKILIVLRTEAERRDSLANAWIPVTGRQWGLYVATCVLAGLVEESTYRGVVVWLLASHIGQVPSALVSATAFAIAHARQRKKAVLVIFGMALSQHWLVHFTGTLVVAMAIHAAYDLAAGLLRSRSVPREEPARESV